MHPFRRYVHTFVLLTDAEWAGIARRLEKCVYPKNTKLLSQGKICRHLYFLETGLLRYSTDLDGEESTKFFTFPPYCFTSQRSLTAGTPAEENIITLEESTVWKLSREDAFGLLDVSPGWNKFVRLLIQEVQYKTEQLLVASQTLSAKDRYARMLEEEGEMIQRIPLKHLASFLGIAPQSLSRIRKKMPASRRS